MTDTAKGAVTTGDQRLSGRQIALARHALGLPNKNNKSYRNYFVAGANHNDFGDWVEMCVQGFARRRINSRMCGGDDMFWLTPEGAKIALLEKEQLDPEDFPVSPDRSVQSQTKAAP